MGKDKSNEDSFFINYDDLSDEELIAKVNRNRKETEEYNEDQLDD